MRAIVQIALFLLMLGAASGASADKAAVRFIRFPAGDTKLVGQIDKLSVTVASSWISGLRNLPKLYDIRMGYDKPTENSFEAVPRLGAAAVDLDQWSNVIGVLVPNDPDGRSCFSVRVTAEGRGAGISSISRQWNSHDLGF